MVRESTPSPIERQALNLKKQFNRLARYLTLMGVFLAVLLTSWILTDSPETLKIVRVALSCLRWGICAQIESLLNFRWLQCNKMERKVRIDNSALQKSAVFQCFGSIFAVKFQWTSTAKTGDIYCLVANNAEPLFARGCSSLPRRLLFVAKYAASECDKRIGWTSFCLQFVFAKGEDCQV